MFLIFLALACTGEGPSDSGPVEADADTDADTDTDTDTDVAVEDCDSEGDEDGDGLADCEDPDCVDLCMEDCTNGIDDDADGLIDCNDEECSGETLCTDGYRVEVTVKLDTLSVETGQSSTYGYDAILRGSGAVYLAAAPYGEGADFACSGVLQLAPGSGATYGSGLCDGCDWKFDLEMSPFWVGDCPVGTPLPVTRVGVSASSNEVTRDFDGTWPVQYIAAGMEWSATGGTLVELEQQTPWAFSGIY